jgi:hypothetical protein
VKVCPAIVRVPVRAAPLFDATLNDTDPLPLPDAPLVTLMNASFADAVQAQPAPAVTATLPPPPVESTDWLFGAIE